MGFWTKLITTCLLLAATVVIAESRTEARMSSSPSKASDLVNQLRVSDVQIRELTARLKQQKIITGAAQPESGFSSSSHNLDFVTPRCDPKNDPRPTSCVQNCQVRFSNGSCGSYGPDYCAHRASCSPHCTVRFSNGSCGSYDADFCGEDVTCSPNCTVRFSNGTCGSYGPDNCG